MEYRYVQLLKKKKRTLEPFSVFTYSKAITKSKSFSNVKSNHRKKDID